MKAASWRDSKGYMLEKEWTLTEQHQETSTSLDILPLFIVKYYLSYTKWFLEPLKGLENIQSFFKPSFHINFIGADKHWIRD